MPNSELHRITKGNLESTQTKMSHCSTDLDFPPDNEFVELVCENGQILMQGQSNKTRKNISGFPSFSSKGQEKDGEDAVIPTFSKFGNMSTVLNDFSSSSGHLSNMGLGQDDDIVPWLNYPLDDGLQHDYCSEFFSELTGVNLNALSSQNNAVPIEKNNSYSQMVRDPHIVSVHGDANPEEKNKSKVAEGIAELPKPRGSQLYHSPLKECQTPVPPLRPKVSDFISYNGNSDHQASCRNSNQTPPVSVANTRIQRQDSGPTRILPTSAGLMNFSHFARPAALAKANLQNINVGASPGSSSMDKLRNNEKISSVGSSPIGSTTAELTSGSRTAAGFQNQHVSVSGKLGVNSSICKSPKEGKRAEQTGAVCREDASRSTKLPDQVHRQNSSVAASTNVGSTEKDVEPIVASSSICSGNSAGTASNDPKHILKRKSREVEESECQSDDVEEESMGAKKPTTARGGMGAKRSRAAEVHNLSERRRRDRINEKMRALQELIPNCNKVDKASMLDEAIEYLKTLQLQVQIMSMGTGLYMPQMMLPTGMQRMHPQHLPHFNPMGVGMGMGMGMGMGYGMGMVDMSNGSSACPVMQMPRMHGVQYPCPSFPPVAGSNLQMFGLPGQGHPMSMPRVPYIPPSEGPSTSSVPASDVSLTATPPDRPDSAPSSSSQDPKLSINSQMMQKTGAVCSQNQTSQVKEERVIRDQGIRPSPATREGFDQPDTVQRNDQALHVGSNGSINSSNGNGIRTSRAGYN